MCINVEIKFTSCCNISAFEDISDAAPTAGMHVTSTVSAAPDWSGYRLVGKKSYG